jgi:hypothetical protein
MHVLGCIKLVVMGCMLAGCCMLKCIVVKRFCVNLLQFVVHFHGRLFKGIHELAAARLFIFYGCLFKGIDEPPIPLKGERIICYSPFRGIGGLGEVC